MLHQVGIGEAFLKTLSQEKLIKSFPAEVVSKLFNYLFIIGVFACNYVEKKRKKNTVSTNDFCFISGA